MLGVASLREAGEATLEASRDRLPETLFRRARHVVTENTRVQAAAEGLRSSNIEAFGHLMFESHASLRDDFEVSTAALDLLVDLATRTEGVLGARLTGAGFGGCTVNLVTKGAEGRFRREVVEPYQGDTGLPAEMHVCRSMAGLEVRIV
jgi:galactokinase